MISLIGAIGSVIALATAIVQLVLQSRKLEPADQNMRIGIDGPDGKTRDVVVTPDDVDSVETLLGEISLASKRKDDESPGK